jgi:transcriptional regulator with XRE-family HTH domain
MRQKQVAGILGISQVHLGKLERGDRRIDVARPALRARIQAFIDG